MTTGTDRARELATILATECKSTGDIQEMLKDLFASTVEQILEAEMEEHLGYEKHNVQGNNSGNSRNGYGKKVIHSEYGESEIAVPRDRSGRFEPQIINKRQTRTDEIESKVLAMYQKGMSTRDIEDSIREIYGAEVSASLISRITDKVLPEINEWQNRPLSDIYPVIFFDGIVFKTRKDSKIINKCVYTVLGVDLEGQKEILGIWLSENESASFWAAVCNDLKNRGVKDIFVACHDNLKGIGGAIMATFPQCDQQLCIVPGTHVAIAIAPRYSSRTAFAVAPRTCLRARPLRLPSRTANPIQHPVCPLERSQSSVRRSEKNLRRDQLGRRRICQGRVPRKMGREISFHPEILGR